VTNTRNLLSTVAITIPLLAACGGGGGASDPVPDSSRPLAKFVRSYVYCDGNERAQLTIAEVNSTTISLTIKSDYYQNTNCAGAIVGTESVSAPIQAIHQSTGSATVTGWPAANSTATLSVDRTTFQIPALTTTVTGTGVTTVNGERCVAYTNGRTCIDVSPTTAQTIVGGLAFTDTALLILTATSTGYTREEAYPR